MRLPALLALIPLPLAFCVPTAPMGSAASKPPARPVAAGELLRRLALDVPAGVDPRALPLAGGAAAAPAAAPAFALGALGPDDAARASDCLTAAIYYEARSEPVDGQRAVAQVVLNRVRDRAFPRSVCGVVFQGSERRTGCQFSFTCDGSMHRGVRNPAAWDRARMVADAALSGSVYAPVGSATHYHASYMTPWWASSLARVGAVGAHVFYRWGGALERALTFRQGYAGVEPTVSAGAVAAVGEAVPGADENGVRVHRASLTDPGPDAPAEEPAVPDGPVQVHRNAQVASRAAPYRTVAGVRIHPGSDAPLSAEGDPAG